MIEAEWTTRWQNRRTGVNTKSYTNFRLRLLSPTGPSLNGSDLITITAIRFDKLHAFLLLSLTVTID